MELMRKLVHSTLLIIITAGCDTEALHEMNINPNTVNEIEINYIFTAAELGSASSGSIGENPGVDSHINIQFCGHAIQHFATLKTENQSIGDKYLERDVNLIWEPRYIVMDVGTQTAEIIRQTGTGGYAEGRKINTRHAARILRVFCFHRLTDWFGSIPYFEANRGIEGIIQPKYDKQRDIYADLLNELDEACAGLSTSNIDDGFAAADIIFKGDITKWKKWGYSLMLRLAMRVSNVDNAMADKYVTKALSGGLMSNNDDNPWVPMAPGPNPAINQNGISRTFNPNSPNWSITGSFLSKTLIDWLMGPDKTSVADDDPRLMIFSGGIIEWTSSSLKPLPGGMDPLNQNGLPNGLDQAMINTLYGGEVVDYQTFSSVNPLMMDFDEPYQLMNAAECRFLMAEALERGIGTGIPGTAEDHYNLGVKLAMQLYAKYDPSFAVSDGRVAQYLETYPYGVAKPPLEMIGEQLWASKFMNWWEAWSDWRRTGFPALIPVNYPGNSTNGQIPTKISLRSDQENPNYKTGATQPDDMTGKVWWDGGPE